jgi:hypothetical protein
MSVYTIKVLPSKIIVTTVFPIGVESNLADHGSQIL